MIVNSFTKWKQLRIRYTNADTLQKINLLESTFSKWFSRMKRKRNEMFADNLKKVNCTKRIFKIWIQGMQHRDTLEFQLLQKQKVSL